MKLVNLMKVFEESDVFVTVKGFEEEATVSVDFACAKDVIDYSKSINYNVVSADIVTLDKVHVDSEPRLWVEVRLNA